MFQTIINQFPPHRVYIEPFVGGGNIFERKARTLTVLADLDSKVVAHWCRECATSPEVTVLQANALELLSSYPWRGDELVYLDPPYVHSTRKDVALYNYELSDAQHAQLLELVASIPARVALSGYRCPLYDDFLLSRGWRRIDFKAMTRRGPATESLWMNYPAPARLADYSHVGSNFRERERIKRKAARWIKRFEQLPELERAAIVSAMEARGVIGVDQRQERRGDPIAEAGGPRATAAPAMAPGAAMAAVAQLAMEY